MLIYIKIRVGGIIMSKEKGFFAEFKKFIMRGNVIDLADSGSITNTVAKEVFELIFKDDIDPEKYVEEKGLKTVDDEGALRETVQKVLAENPQSVEDYHNGKEKAIGFLVGQTMKAMKGKADPGTVNQMLKELL